MRNIEQTSQQRPQRRRAACAAPILAVSLASLALTVLPAVGQPAAAQATQCAAREAIIERLSVKYEETPVSLGVTATGSLLEVLASPSGSWTIIVTLPGGPTCLVSSGEGWRNAPIQLAEDPAV